MSKDKESQSGWDLAILIIDKVVQGYKYPRSFISRIIVEEYPEDNEFMLSFFSCLKSYLHYNRIPYHD